VAAALLARAAEGSMRDALSLLDQLIAFGGGALNEENTRTMLGTIDRGHVSRLVDALSRGDGPALLAEVAELDRSAPDYDRALVELAAFLQRVAIVQIVPDAAQQDEEFDSGSLAGLAQTISPEDIQLYYQIALGGRRDLAMAPEPRAGFEMTLLRMLAFRPESTDTQDRSPVRAAAVAAPAARTSAPAARTSAPAAGAPVHDLPVMRLTSVDASNWPAVLEAANLSGMVRQFALNCVPAKFERDVLTLQLDQSTADRRVRSIEDKLLQGLSKYLGRDIRIVFETAPAGLATPARQRALDEKDKIVRAAAAFEADPAVKGLRERFGAEIDAASVKPAN
jgi:DNA polymerase-3 subunit gamma/tau